MFVKHGLSCKRDLDRIENLRILDNLLILLSPSALSTVGPTAVGNTRWGQDSYSHLDHDRDSDTYFFYFLFFTTKLFSQGNVHSVPKSFLFFFTAE